MATYPTEYRYKIGDKVLVKNDLHEALTYSDSYKMRSGPRAGGWASCTKRHLSFAGAIVTIKSYKNGGYHIVEAPDADFWTDDMFVSLANENECYCESLL